MRVDPTPSSAESRTDRVLPAGGGRKVAVADKNAKSDSAVLKVRGSNPLPTNCLPPSPQTPSLARPQLSPTQLDEFRECFDAFDKDGGGSIDSAELEALMNSLGQSPSPTELEKMVELADADGSGDIDFVEFVTLMAHKMQDQEEDDEDERLKSAFAIFVSAANFSLSLSLSLCVCVCVCAP